MTVLHLAQEYDQWPDLLWQGTAGAKRHRPESTFPEIAGFAHSHTLIAVDADTKQNTKKH